MARGEAADGEDETSVERAASGEDEGRRGEGRRRGGGGPDRTGVGTAAGGEEEDRRGNGRGESR